MKDKKPRFLVANSRCAERQSAGRGQLSCIAASHQGTSIMRLAFLVVLLTHACAFADRVHHIDVLIVTTTDRVKRPELDVEGVRDIFNQAKRKLEASDGVIEDPNGGERIAVQLNIHEIYYDPASENELTDRIGDLIVSKLPNATNTVFCYMKLHGACDKDGEHFMQMKNGQLAARKAVVNLLRSHGAELTILLTDSCSSGPVRGPRIKAAAVVFPFSLFADLFIHSRGFVDVNSSTCNPESLTYETAWMNSDGEGVFSRALIRSLTKGDPDEVERRLKDVDVGKNGRYCWKEFFSYLTSETHGEFVALKGRLEAEKTQLLQRVVQQELDDEQRQFFFRKVAKISDLLVQPDQRPQARSELPTDP
jgi:hypothetical protein